MNFLIKNLFLFIGILISSHSLHAERTCRIVYPNRPDSAPQSAFLFDGTNNQEISLPSMNLSEVITLPLGEICIALTAAKIERGIDLPEHTPHLKIPENLLDFYIILRPDTEDDKAPFRMELVDIVKENLKLGETLWCNYTKNRIAAKLGPVNMNVEANARSVSQSPLQDSGYYSATFTFQAIPEGEFAPITEQSWWHDVKSRHLGIISDSTGKLPQIFFFRDFRIPEEIKGDVTKPSDTVVE